MIASTVPRFLLTILSLCGCALGLASPTSGRAASDDMDLSRQLPTPPALRPALYQSLASFTGQVGKDGCATVPRSSLEGCFDAHGARFKRKGAAALNMRLLAYGRGKDLHSVAPISPQLEKTRVSYRHGFLTEWWRVLPMGFEQGFTIPSRTGGSGEITLSLAASDVPQQHDGAVAWGQLRYGELVVTDASGNTVPSTLRSQHDRVLVLIDDRQATYPLTVDPLIWLEQKVTASDGAANDNFGISVALSNNTALIGAYFAPVGDNPGQGAVYVFTRQGGVWNETQKLTASDGAPYDNFGLSVAISDAYAFVGTSAAAIGGNSSQGATYVFNNTGGTWLETQKLVASDGAANEYFGTSVAISGATGLVGAFNAAGHGAAYVFTNSNGSWVESQKLTASDGVMGDNFGVSVALSEAVILVGANLAHSFGPGAVYVFKNSGVGWDETQELVASDGMAGDQFGLSVALSGTNALIGAYAATIGTNPGQGAAYIFTDSDDSWSETQKLIASDGASYDSFGFSVGLSGDTALVGANYAAVGDNTGQGAAYVFAGSDGSWGDIQKFAASDGATDDAFATSVAISGTTSLVGAYNASVEGNSSQGASYFYSSTPTLAKSFMPDTITANDASVLTITLANTNDVAATLSADLVDNLPTPVVVANPANAATTCPSGIVIADAGTGAVTLDAGAQIPAAGTCTVTVSVTADSEGDYTNTIPVGSLQTDLGNNPEPATADLTVSAITPVVAKAFAPNTINTGAVSTLTITLTNGNALAATLTSALTDTLPSSVVVADPPNAGTTCPGGAVTANAGATLVSLSNGAEIPATGSCTVTVPVTSSTEGTYTNTIPANALQTNFGSNADPTSAVLTVTLAIPPDHIFADGFDGTSP